MDEREPKVVLARIDALLTGIDDKAKRLENPSAKRETQRQLVGFKMRRDEFDDAYDAELAESLLGDLSAVWERLQNSETV